MPFKLAPTLSNWPPVIPAQARIHGPRHRSIRLPTRQQPHCDVHTIPNGHGHFSELLACCGVPLDTGVSRYIGGYCKGPRRREPAGLPGKLAPLEAVRIAIRIRGQHRAWVIASHGDPYVTRRHVIPNAQRNRKACQWGRGRSRTRLLTVALLLRFLALGRKDMLCDESYKGLPSPESPMAVEGHAGR